MENKEMQVLGAGSIIDVGVRDPQTVLSDAQHKAKVLQSVIANKKKPVIFNGEQYLELEDWLTCATFFGLMIKTGDAVQVEIDGVKGAKASATVYDSGGNVVGGAEAYCMRDEANWKSKPWFQLASMAQTRAGSKALRNRLAWVVVLAGYKATPAEEMQDAVPFHSNPASAPALEGDTVTFVPVDVRVKEGTNKNGKPYKKYGIVGPDDKTYGTFDDKVGELAEKAKVDKLAISIKFQMDANGKYYNITAAELAE